jgi:hypothetical protein
MAFGHMKNGHRHDRRKARERNYSQRRISIDFFDNWCIEQQNRITRTLDKIGRRTKDEDDGPAIIEGDEDTPIADMHDDFDFEHRK